MTIMKRYSLWLLVALAGVLGACSDSNDDNKTPAPSIKLEEKDLVFETSGGSLNVPFETNVAWTAAVDQDWCQVSPASGQAGSVSVTVTADENETCDERNAKLTLTAGGLKKTLVIKQKQKDALTVTSNRIDVGFGGEEITVVVKANVEAEYEMDEATSEWITPIETRAIETTNFRFNVAPNESAEGREGKIVVYSGELRETVMVYQGGSVPTLVVNEHEHTVGSEGDVVVIEVSTNLDYEMVLPEGVDWLSEVQSRALSTFTRRIQVAPNDTYEMREAEIHIINREEEMDEVVHIVQVQNDAIVVARPSYDVPAEGDRLDFTVQANVEFEVVLSADWIKQVQSTRALEEVPLSFTVEPNPGQAPREATITLKADNVEQVITVSQAGDLDENRVSIVHSGETFIAPSITGEYFMDAYIWWEENGTPEAYREGVVHQYDNAGPRTITIESSGAEEISLSNLVGVSEIDLTEF